jgi:hypothetical protein
LTGFYSNDKTSIIVSSDWRYLLSVLNSAVSWWWTQQLFASKAGGFFEFKPMYVSAVPIPTASSQQKCCIEDAVDCVLNRIAAAEYERLLNGLVYELFFPEDLHAKGIRLFDTCTQAGIPDWPTPPAETDTTQAAQQARAQFVQHASATAAEIFQPSHPIYGMLFELQAVEVVRIIEGVA